MTDSVCRRKTRQWIRFSHLFANRVKNSAGAIRSRLSTRELDPDVGQPETVSDSALGRYNAIRGHAAVMHAHAAVHEDRVEIGLSSIQLKNCLAVLALVRREFLLLTCPPTISASGRGRSRAEIGKVVAKDRGSAWCCEYRSILHTHTYSALVSV